MFRMVLIFLLFVMTLQAQAGAIIVHRDNNSEIGLDDVIQLYLFHVETFPNGESAIPLDQTRNNQVRNRFTSDVLDSTLFRLRAHYSKLLFTGKGQPPLELTSDRDVIQRVANNPKLIGYVSAMPNDESVKVIMEF